MRRLITLVQGQGCYKDQGVCRACIPILPPEEFLWLSNCHLLSGMKNASLGSCILHLVGVLVLEGAQRYCCECPLR